MLPCPLTRGRIFQLLCASLRRTGTPFPNTMLESCITKEKGWARGQDKKVAADWLKKAAEQGYPQAQFIYSAMNFTADGIERNIPDGVKWMRKAAENGLAEAQFRLGMMYINGDNIEKNRETGIKWVKKAAKQGHVNAKKLLKVMEEK
jgi:TPR repeat protein